MCRSIKTLHNFDPPASRDEIRPSGDGGSTRSATPSCSPSAEREALFDRIAGWCTAWAVGHASPRSATSWA